MKKRLCMLAVVAVCALQNIVMAVPAAAATRYETGIATSGSLVGMGRKALQKRLDDIKSLGATWIRVDFSWPTIQPHGRDHYNWSGYDYVVHQASARGLKILAVLAYTPDWAQDPVCKTLVSDRSAAKKCNPQHVQDFARFAGVLAERYKHDRIRGYEIWNEPNLLSYWRTVRDGRLVVSPVAFADYANAAAVEIRKHNVDGVILPGGLAPLFEPSSARGMSQSDFTAKMLPHLHKDLFAGIAVHPYSWPAQPDTPEQYNAFYTVDGGDPNQSLRDVMQRAGWGDKEIWATEFGASTRGSHRTDAVGSKRPDHVTESEQASIIKNGMTSWYKKQNVGPIFIHSDNDAWLGTRNNESGFGLRRRDGSQKPSYQVFKDVSGMVNAADTRNDP